MLLKLIPPPSQPTIHFSLTLPIFPSYLDTPQFYTAQINHLLMEELEVPGTLYSLDKSVKLMSLLDEVIFEIKDGTGDRDGGGGGGDDDEKTIRVTCRFVDGALEEWATTGAGLISVLDGIIHNVQESTLEDGKERERYRQSQLQNNRSRALNRLSMPPGLSPMTGTKPRHKKQRSLFMQIVSCVTFSFTLFPTKFIFHSSIANLTSPISSSSSHLPTFVDPSHPESFYPPPPTSPTSAPTSPSSNRARSLRRTARSDLVDAYRRHVVPELTRRFPKEGGFSVWVLHSMRRRAWERMEDLIEEGARLHREHQQVLELRQRHEHEEREQEQQYLYHLERAKSPILANEQPFGPRFGMEEAGFSTTTMNVPLSFSDEGGSTESENESANVSRINSEEVEDDLETITDDSSIHTPSSTSHIGTGFMGGGGSSPTFPTAIQPPPLPLKPSPFNSQPPLPPHFLLEYSQLSCLRQRLHSLLLFADSQIRIADEDKRNRDEILLVRGRRRAWLNGELARGIGGATTGTSNGMGQMQCGFAAPFKSSPLARYSWSASAELDEASKASVNYTGVCPQYEEDEDEYDEFCGPPALRIDTLDYTHGRQSRRSRYSNGGGRLCKKLLPVAEECECEIPTLDNVNSNVDGSVHYSCHHRDTSSCLHLHQEDEDVDSSSDMFSPEDPRELDLELGFGLHDPTSFIGEDPEESLGDDSRSQSSEQVGFEGEQQQYGQRERSGETSRVAFEMERPKIIPSVRDGLDDSISMTMSVGTSNGTSTSTRSGSGLLSWGYWGVGKNSGNGNSDSGDGAVRGNRSWKNGIGIGIGIGLTLGGRGRSLNKTCQSRELEKEEEQEQSRRRQPRLSTSSSASTASSSSTKSQKQPQQHPREPSQVGAEPVLHQDQEKDYSSSTPLLCQPVSSSVSHTVAAQAAISALPRPATPTGSLPTTVAILPSNDDTPTSSKGTAETPKNTTRTLSVSANGTKTSFIPTAPLSFTTKRLCMASPAPSVYADIDVSVVHVMEDEKGLNRGFGGAGQSVNNPNAASRAETQAQGGASHTPRLRPRRHKREYQYQYPYQQHHQHVCGDKDECDEFELSGYGHFSGGSTADSTHLLSPKNHPEQQYQQRHNSMIHARLHLDELLLEEGLFNNGCHDVVDQEEFTLAMDVPLSRPGGRASKNMKAMKKMQFLQLYQNRDSAASQQLQQPSRLQVYEQQQQVGSSPPPSSSQATANSLNEGVRESSGSVVC